MLTPLLYLIEYSNRMWVDHFYFSFPAPGRPSGSQEGRRRCRGRGWGPGRTGHHPRPSLTTPQSTHGHETARLSDMETSSRTFFSTKRRHHTGYKERKRMKVSDISYNCIPGKKVLFAICNLCFCKTSFGMVFAKQIIITYVYHYYQLKNILQVL